MDEELEGKDGWTKFDMPSFYISPVDDHLGVFNWNSARSVSLAKKTMIAGVVGDHGLGLVVVAETGLNCGETSSGEVEHRFD